MMPLCLPRALTLIAVVLALALAGCSSDEVEASLSGQLPESFPEEFPLPPGAVPIGASDVATLEVSEASPDELVAFFETNLPPTGWEVLEDWDGVDVGGAATSGLILQKGEETGAIALTETERGVLVRVNLRQPEHQEMGPSMGAGGHEHGPAAPDSEHDPAAPDDDHGPAVPDGRDNGHSSEEAHGHPADGDE